MKKKLKICVITGGGSGIGKALACLLSKSGIFVIIIGRNLSKLKSVIKSIVALGGKGVYYKMDLTNEFQVKMGFKKIFNKHGNIDILINNAGIIDKSDLSESLKQWKKVIDTNLNGVFLCLKCVLPKMVSANSGVIINISSILSYFGSTEYMSYSASKAAVINLTKSVYLKYSMYNIYSFCIVLGPIDTPLLRKVIPFSKFNSLKKHIPSKRIGSTKEVAESVLNLISNLKKYKNGSLININV